MKKEIQKTLEIQLSKTIRSIYLQELNHPVGSILFHFFQQALIIIIEDSVTLPEKKLKTQEYQKLVNQVRSVFYHVIKPQIKATIEKTTNMHAVDFLCDTTLDTGRTGIIVILELNPQEVIPASN
jgi:uncharacterized protein YbcI